MSHKKVKLPWVQRAFYSFGTLFCITATCYFGMLLWKSYVWWKWLKHMEQQLIRQVPPTDGPLIPPSDNLLFTNDGGDKVLFTNGKVSLEEIKRVT